MILGLDIGGANLKAADGKSFVRSEYFPLWQRPNELAAALAGLLARAPAADTIAVTMTGELADCYATKQEGVRAIIRAVEQAAGARRVLVYLTAGTFVEPAVAMEQTLAAAASNWHALATFAGRFAPAGQALLVDIGSTTSDLIPLLDGVPRTSGLTDPERLLHGELVYTGVVRSPLCALVKTIPWRDGACAVAQELFATTWDAYLTLGDLPEEPDSRHTADGRPATRAAARDRLARMICADAEMFSPSDGERAAQAVAEAQLHLLWQAARQATARAAFACEAQPGTHFLISGQGEFLARRLVQLLDPRAVPISLHAILGSTVSQCAPAHAVAVLAREAWACEALPT